jgi:hypothetical protein
VDVFDVVSREQSPDLVLDRHAVDAALLDERAARTVRVERERMCPERVGNSGVRRVSVARTLVNEHGSGQGKLAEVVEGIVGE